MLRFYFQMIQWQDNHRQNEIARSFQLLHGLPGVYGILNGKHIQLAGCLDEDQDYIKRNIESNTT